MRSPLPRLLLFASCLAAPAQADLTTVRSYAVEGHGTIELAVPMRWTEEVIWSDDRRPTVRYAPRTPGDDGGFALSLTAVPAGGTGGTVPAQVRALVESSARASLGVAADAPLGLEEIDGRDGAGWFYTVTDTTLPDPPPAGRWRVMTQGAIGVGDVVLTATLLTQKGWTPAFDQVLDLLRGARLTTSPADAWRIPGPVQEQHGALGQRYAMDIPEGFRLTSNSPLSVTDPETGGLFRVLVEERETDLRSQLDRLERQEELLAPGAWTRRHRGPTTVAGVPAGEVTFADEHRDLFVHQVAIVREGWLLTATWEVSPHEAKAGELRLKQLLSTLRLREAPPAH